MKKVLVVILNLIIVWLFALLGFLLIYPYAAYKNTESTSMNIWIIDKTVPNTDFREHKGLLWLLNNEKIISQKTGELFEYSSDYYGFYPIDEETYETKEIPDDIEYPDLIYLADTYGVYKDDYFADNIQGTRSELIAGGLLEEETAKIKANLGGGNTIIGEFNIASAPTNQVNRDQLGEIFRMDWTGWSGRYFVDLSKGIEVPVWAVNSYVDETGNEWSFTGEGIILVYNDDKIVVFEKDKDYGKDQILITFRDEYLEEFGIKGNIPYEYWFEFTTPDSSAEIIADFTFDVTESGAQKLAALGLEESFPAVIRNRNTQYTSYYFAGDFADGNIEYKWWDWKGFAEFKKLLPLGEKGENAKFYWRCYVPMMASIIDDIKIKNAQSDLGVQETQFNVRAVAPKFQVLVDDEWQDFFVKGVNIGSSTPGKWFTQFDTSESLYLEWLEQIAGMNANTIRVYTLLPPQFYTAFVYYNESHPEKPLWLFQEIWPEENPEDDNYLKDEYNEAYRREIEYVVDAINGQANIPFRTGRAYGIYTSDVSPYLAGYLVGRELEPEEVITTNELNEGFAFDGDYLYCSADASPTEAWLAMNCDYVAGYEASKYGWQHPVGIVSWPTLDVAEHDSEWNEQGDKNLEYNDKVSIDINNIEVKDALKAGFFGAYHIYPNYPDFMNNETSYAEYEDDEGVFRYGGYLQEFIAGHKKYPAIVAEFGLSTGMGDAHSNPDGYNHGGLSEQEQGEGIVRMMESIRRENFAGGIIFEWTDEWAKKTWTTEPYIIPYERNVLWHNVADPEQNYGIYAMEAAGIRTDEYIAEGTGTIDSLELGMDEEYLYITVNLSKSIDFANERLIVGLDTFRRDLGDYKYSKDIEAYAPFGLEFVIDISDENDAEILVQPGYNFTIGLYAPEQTDEGIYEEMVVLTNKETVTKQGVHIDAVYDNISILDYGSFDNNTLYTWTATGDKILLRIPWMLISFSDPSDRIVLNDNDYIPVPLKEEIDTVKTDGILAGAILAEKAGGQVIGEAKSSVAKPFVWDSWDVPAYTPRLKDSYAIIRDYFGSIANLN